MWLSRYLQANMNTHNSFCPQFHLEIRKLSQLYLAELLTQSFLAVERGKYSDNCQWPTYIFRLSGNLESDQVD